MTQFDKTVAVITGGGSGIGLAAVARLSALGATVVAADVDRSARAAVADVGGIYHYLDVTDADAWASFVGAVLDHHGHIDVAHLNAGVMSAPRGSDIGGDPLTWVTHEAFRRVLAVNLEGVYNGVVALLPHYLARGAGDIVVTSSIGGLAPLPLDPNYSISKHALVGLVRSLAPTLSRHGIRIQALCPGAVDTPILPPDVRGSDRKFGDPMFQADALVNSLEVGRPGDIWRTLGPDSGFERLA